MGAFVALPARYTQLYSEFLAFSKLRAPHGPRFYCNTLCLKLTEVPMSCHVTNILSNLHLDLLAFIIIYIYT